MQNIYKIQFQQVVNKGEETSINCIKIFNHDKDLAVLVGNIYYKDHLICAFLENFQHGGKYSAQLSSHQAEFR